jgi:hypothetical protein
LLPVHGTDAHDIWSEQVTLVEGMRRGPKAASGHDGACDGPCQFLLFDPKAVLQDTQAFSGGPPRLAIPDVRHQHPECGHQNTLRLLLPHRPAAPALPAARSAPARARFRARAGWALIPARQKGRARGPALDRRNPADLSRRSRR